MDRDVLSNKEIKEALRKEFVYLRVDIEKRRDIPVLYNIYAYPSVALLEPNGKRIAHIPGYVSKKEFNKILIFLKGKKYKTTSLRDFLKNYREKEK